MILSEIGPRSGKLVDIAHDAGGWVAAFHDEADGAIVLVQLHPDGSRRVGDVRLYAGAGNAYPVICVDAGATWLAYRLFIGGDPDDPNNFTGILRNLTSGQITDIGIVHGNCPIAFGPGWVAWQCTADFKIARSALPFGLVTVTAQRGAGTGLVLVTYDGQAVTVDQQRFAHPGMVNPRTAGRCTVGENADAGPDRAIAALPDGRICELWPGHESFTPHVATDGGSFAIATWGDSVRLALVTDRDFRAPAPAVDPWALVPDGTLITDASKALFGDHPPLSPDGKRICFRKNVGQAEWRELGPDGWVYHLFDRSRGEDVPTGPRQGWYLTPRECCKWAKTSFRSGESFSVEGEKVEYDTGARVRWTHRVTLYGLKAGGILVKFDPRFPGQDYGPSKLYELHYNSLTAGVRWVALYSPVSTKGRLPWGDASEDVVIQEATAPISSAPTAPYLECPRLSVDDDPRKTPTPKPMPDTITAQQIAEFVAQLNDPVLLGARQRYRDEVLLPRDRVSAATDADGHPANAADMMTGGAAMFFDRGYVRDYLIARMRGAGVVDASVLGLIGAANDYKRAVGIVNPAPTPAPGVLSGPIGIAGKDFATP